MIKKILVILILTTLLYSCKAIEPKKSDYEKIEEVFSETRGIPYRYGGVDIRGFDCSGYVNYIYNRVYKLKIPRTTELLMQYGESVQDRKREVGDLIFFRPTTTYNHVGIYVGGGDFIHSSSSKGITRSSFTSGYWAKYYKTTRRINR